MRVPAVIFGSAELLADIDDKVLERNRNVACLPGIVEAAYAMLQPMGWCFPIANSPVTGDVLTLKGEKRQEKEEKNKNWYLSERTYGSFQRAFTLPYEVDRDKIAASCANGVLTVTLPRRAEAQKQQKKIEVKAA
jgi:hypothetical protein